jgi:hypothetical protein
MSHRVLKPDMKEPKGLFSDLSDIAEVYFHWTKNKLCSQKEARDGKGGWSKASSYEMHSPGASGQIRERR